MKATIVEKITYKGSQSISFREIYKLKNKRIKLEIKSDSYEQQCYARAYILKDEKWELIYSIPYSEMETAHGLSHHLNYRNDASKAEDAFKIDVQRLKECMNELLFN